MIEKTKGHLLTEKQQREYAQHVVFEAAAAGLAGQPIDAIKPPAEHEHD